MPSSSRPPFALIIMDGLGNNPNPKGNAVANANTPTLDRLRQHYPNTELTTHGARVGLPEGQMGNSEVGHLNIGGGRIVQQELTRINESVARGEIGRIPAALQTFQVAANGAALHFIGLLSTGGVHSHVDHLKGLIDGALNAGVRNIFIQAITDGRDRPPNAALDEVSAFQEYLNQQRIRYPKAQIGIVSIIGRYFAMDRDKRWERTKKAYDLLTLPADQVEDISVHSDPLLALKARATTGDEFLKPISISTGFDRHTTISDGDAVLFFNFRADRMRQIVTAFTDGGFADFVRAKHLQLSAITTLTEYESHFPVSILFRPQKVKNHLGEVVSNQGLAQLRIAETEKYPHVTYFFNGGVEEAWPGEERILVPSPRDVPTYDKKPEMSAFGVTEKLLEAIAQKKFDVFIINFANCDMVGHTGVFDAAVKAVETVDSCVGKVIDALLQQNGQALVTADHGNAEQMIDYVTNEPHTFHTTYPVPLFWVTGETRGKRLRTGGALCDLSPTILEILGIAKPSEMSGKSLLSS